MRALLFILSLLCLRSNAFADSMACDAGGRSLGGALSDGQVELQTNDPFTLDASLSSGSLFFAVEDTARHRRVAFSGSNLSISPDGALLETGPTGASCRLIPDHVSFAPPPATAQPTYLDCVLDEAKFENSAVVDSSRRFSKLTSPINQVFPLTVSQEDASVAYHVRYVSYEPLRGLDITITDKASGETAHYAGPARSLQKSFMMGLTVGDRAVSARFLRLACVWTDDPKALAQ